MGSVSATHLAQRILDRYGLGGPVGTTSLSSMPRARRVGATIAAEVLFSTGKSRVRGPLQSGFKFRELLSVICELADVQGQWSRNASISRAG